MAVHRGGKTRADLIAALAEIIGSPASEGPFTEWSLTTEWRRVKVIDPEGKRTYKEIGRRVVIVDITY